MEGIIDMPSYDPQAMTYAIFAYLSDYSEDTVIGTLTDIFGISDDEAAEYYEQAGSEVENNYKMADEGKTKLFASDKQVKIFVKNKYNPLCD
jgi:hypothetical protein